ncbi:hypothetical protein BN7_1557 [Wickerhamomyces ciferrii]|uniref:Uncharacterized protein n=1 Tax=Wickerhamomyces ciferrii (strain ATCC 14091 / BCRC 22168 / CBS 111 / JCM 3599 / NBRC 0793 / NRRL Y-1031 F-60-10) TaxID=1206466 RepID=K0KLM0_WICCF|nr:uncharacterized protein BN7_1557 [Wickerhamomyces ciferrii]CCH42018.1 hypothetical protein BN7_1557 [Wickerhamomyces ciferrii]
MKKRQLRILESSIHISPTLSNHPENIQRLIIYAKFMRLKKFISRRTFIQTNYKNYIKERIHSPIPNLLKTLNLMTMAVSENPGQKDMDLFLAKKILDNLIEYQNSKQGFINKKLNAKFVPDLIQGRFDKNVVFESMRKYEEVVKGLNRSLGTCL